MYNALEFTHSNESVREVRYCLKTIFAALYTTQFAAMPIECARTRRASSIIRARSYFGGLPVARGTRIHTARQRGRAYQSTS